MRILHLAFDDLARPNWGGVALKNHELYRRLARQHQVTVVTGYRPGPPEEVRDGVRYRRLSPTPRYYLDFAAYYAALPALLLGGGYDLVVEDFNPPTGATFVPLLARAPVVASISWLFAEAMRRKYHLPFDLVQRHGLRLYHHVVTITHEMAAQIEALNPSARTVVIPRAVAAAAFDLPRRDGGYLLFVGRLDVDQKGLDLLLAAYAEIGEACDAELWIVGDGPPGERARFQALLARHPFRQRIRWLGRVNGAEKFALLAGASVVCMPSRYETFGLVALEACACRAPVVAFDIPCLREALPPTVGTLVPAFDTSAFARAVVTLLHQPARRQALGEAGRTWARRFSWDEHARQYEAFLAETLDRETVRDSLASTI